MEKSLPSFVELGFVRNDRGARHDGFKGRSWLFGDKQPIRNQIVDIELKFFDGAELTWKSPFETNSWHMMQGKVIEVFNNEHVEIEMYPQTDLCPEELWGCWEGEIKRIEKRDKDGAIWWLVRMNKSDE